MEKAHWLWEGDHAVCSNCNYIFSVQVNRPFSLPDSCPECNAEMELDKQLILKSDWEKEHEK